MIQQLDVLVMLELMLKVVVHQLHYKMDDLHNLLFLLHHHHNHLDIMHFLLGLDILVKSINF